MTIPVCDSDFYSDQSIADPASLYRNMLALGPVVWLKKNNICAVVGHAAVTETLRNFQKFSSAKGVSIDERTNSMIVGSTLNSDPPQHNHTRAITFAPLSSKAVLEVKEKIERQSEFISKRVVELQSFDAATELAPHLPLTIVRDLVGLGDYGKNHMLDWGAATFELMGDPGQRRNAAIEKLGLMRTFLEDAETLDNLNPDGWARQAILAGIEAGIDPQKANELMRDYIAPSLDTTISSISYAVYLFASNPDQWQMLRDDRSLMKNAIEEIVRLNTPIRAFSRMVTTDTEIQGAMVTEGSRILIVFGAANRDPLRFADPDKFDITRKVAGHVGFGHGVHACLGMHLARLEMSCLFNALADRVERFELAGPVKSGINSTIHALQSVPVKLVKAA